MTHTFDIIQKTRENFIGIMTGLTIEQLNEIPAGFNNNILWNLGHMVAAQQGLCYRLSGLELAIDATFVSKYAKGTKPEQFIDAAEVEMIKSLALSTVEKLRSDFSNNVFKTYTEYTTSFRITLSSVDDAIRFVAVHDGLHYGYAMALKRAVLNAG